MPAACALGMNSGKIVLIEQCRAVCGPPGIAFSQMEIGRQGADAAPASYGSGGAAGEELALSASLRSAALPKGEPLAAHANFISLPRPLPLGEVDANVVSRRRGRGCFPAAPPLPQEAGAANAVRLYDPTREKVNRENPQIFPIGKFKIILPLKMRRAARRAVQIISSSAAPPAHPGA